MTGNSRYKNYFIKQFSALVKRQGGNFLELLFIRRGRIFWQKSPSVVKEGIKDLLVKRGLRE